MMSRLVLVLGLLFAVPAYAQPAEETTPAETTKPAETAKPSVCHAKSDDVCTCITTAKANELIAEREAAKATGLRPCVDSGPVSTDNVVSVVVGAVTTVLLWVLSEFLL